MLLKVFRANNPDQIVDHMRPEVFKCAMKWYESKGIALWDGSAEWSNSIDNEFSAYLLENYGIISLWPFDSVTVFDEEAATMFKLEWG